MEQTGKMRAITFIELLSFPPFPNLDVNQLFFKDLIYFFEVYQPDVTET